MRHELWSRESPLGGNVLLIAAMLVVLLGTLLPLIHISYWGWAAFLSASRSLIPSLLR